MINNLKKFDASKKTFETAINIISSKSADEELVIHSKSDKIQFMTYDNADEVIGELSNSICITS